MCTAVITSHISDFDKVLSVCVCVCACVRVRVCVCVCVFVWTAALELRDTIILT